MPGQYLVPVLSARASSRTVLQAPVPSPSTGPVLVLVLMARCTFAPKHAAAVVVDVVVVFWFVLYPFRQTRWGANQTGRREASARI